MKHNPTLKMEYQEPLPHPTHLKRERERKSYYSRRVITNRIKSECLESSQTCNKKMLYQCQESIKINKLIPMTITISIC